jgi:hypothetical protein
MADIDIIKDRYSEEDRPLLKNFTKKITDQKQRTALSKLIEETENAVYWETRRELLNKFNKVINNGNAKEYIEYLKNKSKPIIT